MYYQSLISPQSTYRACIGYFDSYPLHYHDEIEVFTVWKGFVHCTVNGTEYHLCTGDTLIIMRNVLHEVIRCSEDSLSMEIEFGYFMLGANFDYFDKKFLESPFFPKGTLPEEIDLSLHNIKRVLVAQSGNTPKEQWSVQGYIYQIAAQLVDVTVSGAPSDRTPLSNYITAMYPVLNYVREHYSEEITVDTAAALVGYDKAHFSKCFKRATGTSFHKYLNYYRINLACGYLSDQNLSINDISERLGYLSTKQFYRVFKEYMSISPTEYRRLEPSKRIYVKPR